MNTFLAHWAHLDDTIHIDDEGDACICSTEDRSSRASEGRLYVEAVERLGAEQGRPVVVTSLVAVA